VEGARAGACEIFRRVNDAGFSAQKAAEIVSNYCECVELFLRWQSKAPSGIAGSP
jgi:hypothetical protein